MQMRDEGPIYLTPEAIQRLKDKRAYLNTLLPNLASEAQRTASFGDRSENAEYKDAKGKLRGAQREILRITDQLKRAVVIKPSANGKIQIGSTVVIQICVPAGTPPPPQTFQIVGPDETNPDRGRISFKSPLGSALMGHVVGDVVMVETATGTTKWIVLEVK